MLALFEYLKKSINFKDEELIAVAPVLQYKKLRKGDHFYEAGQKHTEVAFIMKGILRNYFKKDGKEITYHFAMENDLDMAVSSFDKSVGNYEYVQAVEDTEIVVADYEKVKELYDRYHSWAKFGRLIIEEKFVTVHSQFRGMIMESAQERYLKLSEENPELMKRVPQYYIASFLGITPESLSRLRGQLMKK
jgi:CRP/FNR family transcriptional regulator, anaerobic regulatory protein